MTITPPCFPARPVNGGPLPNAQPKHGDWTLEGKYNGWRAWVHNPTGAMFNRKLEPLSISREFKPALDTLKPLPWEWSDVEALERRHNIGRGSLILLDYLPTRAADVRQIYTERKAYLHLCAAVSGQITVHKELNIPVANDRVYLPMTWTNDGATQLWDILQQCNRALGCDFWEGLVAKRNDSIYPRQRRTAEAEFAFWMKHRWAF